MVGEIKLHLRDLGPISEANINIGKITLVGGPNACGKSTLSKFLYSFLKANSYQSEAIAQKSIINTTIDEVKFIKRYVKNCNNQNITFKFNKKRFDDFDEFVEEYEEFKDQICSFEIVESIDEKLKRIDDLIRIIQEDSEELYEALIRHLLSCEFSYDDFKFNCEITDNEFSNNSFKYLLDFKNPDNPSFSRQGGFVIDDVIYIDSVSVLDTYDSFRFENRKNKNHIDYLKELLITQNSSDIFDEKINKNIIDLENEINEIINGEFVYEKGEFTFISNGNVKSMVHNTASGIKQIGLIQLLLKNRDLKENCVLIIDEPEVNLHPQWQMNFARILTLLSKKLNITVYINTHSTLFVEAIDTFAYYYDYTDGVRYHLAERNSDGYDINEVDPSYLSKIYDHLGKAYFDLDVVKLKKELD